MEQIVAENGFELQVPIEVVERDNGIALIVTNSEKFYHEGYDPNEPPANAELALEAWEFVSENIEDTMRECMMDVLSSEIGKFKLTITLTKEEE